HPTGAGNPDQSTLVSSEFLFYYLNWDGFFGSFSSQARFRLLGLIDFIRNPHVPPPPSPPPAPQLSVIIPPQKPTRAPVCKGGSIIEVDNQALGESIPVTGTPYSMFYYSDRVPGRLDNYKITLPLINGAVPSSLTTVDVDILYADRSFHKTFSAVSNLSYDFFWDGKDASGKLLPGSVNAHITVTNKGPGGSISSTSIVTIGGWSTKTLGINGWSLDVVNFYDKNSRTLYLGSGGFVPVTGFSYKNGFAAPSKDGSELYIFDQFGKHTKTLNGLTGDLKLVFNYIINEGLVSITDNYGNKTIVQHLDSHANKIISPYGQETLLSVDSNGWLSQVKNPNSEIYNMTYKQKGLLISFQKPGGQLSTMTYDPLGFLIKDQGSAGNFLSLFKTTTEEGWKIKTETAEGNKTTYDIIADSLNFTRTTTDSRNLKSIAIDQPLGTSKSQTPEGLLSRETSSPDPRFGNMAPFVQFSARAVEGTNLNYVENTTKNLEFLSSADTFFVKTLVTKTTLQNDSSKTYSNLFNGPARQFTTTSPMGRRSIASLNDKSEILISQEGSLVPIQNSYDERGRLSTITHGERQVSFSYDNLGNLNRSVDSLGRATLYKSDLSGRVVEQTLPNQNKIQYSYDKNGNLTSVTPPQKTAHSFTLNPLEMVSRYLPPSIGGKQTATNYSYNLDKQLTRIDRPDGKSVVLNYDSTTRELKSVVIPDGEYVYSYSEATGQLNELLSPDQVSSEFSYQGPLLSKEKLSFSAIESALSLNYNADFSLKSLGVSSNNGIESFVNINYDKDGLPISIGSENLAYDQNGLLNLISQKSITQKLEYNNYGEVVSDTSELVNLSKDKNSKKALFKMNLKLKRDQLGRIVEKTESDKDEHSITTAYQYDAVGRLTGVFKNNHLIRQYFYDANGNRIKKQDEGKATEASYDEQDRLIRYGKTDYKYNDNGDLTEKIEHKKSDKDGKKESKEDKHHDRSTLYQYDVFGNLKKVVLPNKKIIEYLVDGSNRRVGKKINGKLVQAFVYQSQTQVIAELDGNGKILKRFVYGSKPNIPDYMIINGKEYKIISDQVGTPKSVLDVYSGKVIQDFEFDEFGILKDNDEYNDEREAKILLPFGFAGGLYDEDTKLVRFGARDYDPIIGRWTSKDPIRFNGGDTNLYGYVANDPVNFIDPDGKVAIPFVAIIGSVIAFEAGYGIGTFVNSFFIENKSFQQSLADLKMAFSISRPFLSFASGFTGPFSTVFSFLSDPNTAKVINSHKKQLRQKYIDSNCN
ncbi:MAG: hypothetical protein H7336_15105, partial [Bacteriovorax sp.]|nr:hypothetical protein [Bacteriovorax sp.]